MEAKNNTMKKTELEILKELKFEFELLSDFTTQSQGYKNLCDKIDRLEKTEKVFDFFGRRRGKP